MQLKRRFQHRHENMMILSFILLINVLRIDFRLQARASGIFQADVHALRTVEFAFGMLFCKIKESAGM